MSTLCSLHHVFGSPVRFFRARLSATPNAGLALVVLGGHTMVVSLTALVVVRRTQEVMLPVLMPFGFERALGPVGEILAVVSMTTGVLTEFGASAAVLVTFNLLLAPSGRSRRLVEFAALSYLIQIPWAIAGLVVSTWMWEPDPLHVPFGTSAAELPGVVIRYQEALASAPSQAMIRLVGAYFGIWRVAVQAAALQVVSECRVITAWGCAVLLALIVVIVPYLMR